MWGQGEFKWPGGRIYKGEFSNNLENGEGVLTWPDGRRFEGNWKNG